LGLQRGFFIVNRLIAYRCFLRIQRQDRMAVHASVCRSKHFRSFAAFGTFYDRGTSGQHANPKVNPHADEAANDSEHHEDRGNDLANLPE
jgi:hypothetical protein